MKRKTECRILFAISFLLVMLGVMGFKTDCSILYLRDGEVVALGVFGMFMAIHYWEKIR